MLRGETAVQRAEREQVELPGIIHKLGRMLETEGVEGARDGLSGADVAGGEGAAGDRV